MPVCFGNLSVTICVNLWLCVFFAAVTDNTMEIVRIAATTNSEVLVGISI